MSQVNATPWEFSREQWDALTAVDRHVLVSAGAGTGKTRTVVGRILFLLGVELTPPRGAAEAFIGETRCSLRDIAAITFTNAAAADLKKKLREALIASGRLEEAYDIDLSRIGTIHSFCLDMLREFALQTGANPRDEIVDEATAATIRTEVVRETLLRVLETGEVANLDALLSRLSVQEIRDILDRMLGDSERLRRIAPNKTIPVPERALLDIATVAAETFDARLVGHELIDFERVIVRARDLLERHPPICATLRRRIKTLIIDEFQDVDPVQKEIAYLLGDPESGRADTTRLLLVGDAKQSVYRFRGADVTVWREVLHDFKGKGWGVVCSTTKSFRCSSRILGFVDSTIGKALDTPVSSEGLLNFEVPFEPLSVGRAEQVAGPPVELILIPATDKGKDRSAAERRRCEVYAVAERARQLQKEGYEWGEMAVVLRSWSMAQDYQMALEAVGASAYPLRTTGFFEQREILDLMIALETLCDPADDRALMGFLRSPFVGVSDETLLLLRRTYDGSLWDLIRFGDDGSGLSDPEAARLSAGILLTARFSTLRDRVATHELLERLLHETGYLAHLHLLGEDKEQTIHNVLRLLRQARNASRLSARQFLAFLKQCRAAGNEVSEPIVPRRDAVTITTVHSAKGLEWKVVFWGGLGMGLNIKESGKLLIGRDTIALRDPGATTQPAHYEALQSSLALESLAEEKRLWYVAATRAIERLVLCGVSETSIDSDKATRAADFVLKGLKNVTNQDGSAFAYASAAGENHTGLVIVSNPEGYADPVWPPVRPAPRSIDSLPPHAERIVVPAGRPRHSATEYVTFSACQRRHWLKYTLGIREPAIEQIQDDSQIDAVSRGLIVHDVLERIRVDSELEKLLDDAIQRRDEAAPSAGTKRGKEYRDFLRDEIERVANHPDFAAIANLPGARNELPFLFIANEDEFYEGSVDLAAVEDGKLTLLDVKTPQCDEATARKKAAAYRPQRDVYIASTSKVGGTDVGRFAFQFSRANVQVSEVISARDTQQALRGLAETARLIENQARTATADERACRYCGYASVGWCCRGPQKD